MCAFKLRFSALLSFHLAISFWIIPMIEWLRKLPIDCGARLRILKFSSHKFELRIYYIMVVIGSKNAWGTFVFSQLFNLFRITLVYFTAIVKATVASKKRKVKNNKK